MDGQALTEKDELHPYGPHKRKFLFDAADDEAA